MVIYKNVQSATKPPERLETPTMIDLNYNIHEETFKNEFEGSLQEYKMWVYDTKRFYSWKEYADYLILEHEKTLKTSQEAIGELSVIQAQAQLQNEMAIAELSMMIGGGIL